jgi:exodeoxyribonuclease VII small subunit
MEKQELSYEQAYQELQTIIKEMENNDISIDVLADKIKRALELINLCKDKITKIEVDVDKIVKTIEQTEK